MKTFMRYLIPSIIATILSGMYILIDGYFIGSILGDKGLSGINIAWPITGFIHNIGLGIGIGSGIICSLKKGKKEENSQIIGLGLLLMISAGVVLMALLFAVKAPLLSALGAKGIVHNYASKYLNIILLGSIFQVIGLGAVPILRNLGKVKIAMFALISGSIINFIGDYIFIYWLDLGLEGAALASVISLFFVCIICIVTIFRNVKISFAFTKKDIKDVLLSSIAPFILGYSYSVLIIINNLFCINYGGDECVAAYTVLSYALYIVGMLSQGCADAIQPIISEYNAKGDYIEEKKNYKRLFVTSMLFTVIIVILFIAIKEELGKLFNLSSKGYIYYEEGLVYFIIGFLFVGLIKVNSSYLYAVNDVKKANCLVVLEPFIITPILLFIMSSQFKSNGIWQSFMITQVIVVICSFIFVFKKQKRAS